MKTTLTKQDIYSNRECYQRKEVDKLDFINNSKIQIADLFISKNLPLRHAYWFLFKHCELELKQKLELCLKLAEIMLPIYEKKYPNDARVRECIQAVKDFNTGKITKEELLKKRHAVADAYGYITNVYAAYAAYAVYAATDVVVGLATNAYAAVAAAAIVYVEIKQQLIDCTIKFINDHENNT